MIVINIWNVGKDKFEEEVYCCEARSYLDAAFMYCKSRRYSTGVQKQHPGGAISLDNGTILSFERISKYTNTSNFRCL